MPAAIAIDLPRLRSMLAGVRATQFVTIIARTDARLRKRKNPHWPVEKIARVNGAIGWNYGLTVRRQQLREGRKASFHPMQRDWGRRMKLPASRNANPLRGLVPIIEHKGRLYLELKVERVLDVKYRGAEGDELTAEQVAPFQRARKSQAKHQGVTREIVLRDYALESIESITIGGRTYRVRQ